MFNGSIAAMVTPFSGDGAIDRVAVEGLVDFHLGEGTDALVVAGTTGESATLTAAEHDELLAMVIARVDGRIPVLAGTGSASTAVASARTRRAGELGADGALVVTPYYVRPTQAGLAAHFEAVADASAIPVVLYNVPARTAVDLLPATVARLALHLRIVGIKEAVGRSERIDELRACCGPDFALLSGDDPSCLAAMRHGADGVVSVAANVVPALMRALCAAARTGEAEVAEGLQRRLEPLFALLAAQPNPIPVKWALFEMGRVGPGIRLPLLPLEPPHREPLRQCLETLGALQAGQDN